MSRNYTGMSGGVSYGGINIGSNKGNVNTTQGAQNQGMEQTTITGMTGGNAETVVAAGKITGGVGNIGTHHQVDRSFRNDGTISNAAFGDNHHGTAIGNIGSGQGAGSQRKEASSLTSTELLERVRRTECSDETVKTFADERVTGRVFMTDDLDELLSDLGITKKLDIRKLKSLKDDLSKGMEQTTITGMTGGNAETVVAAGKITGGVGNIGTHHQGGTTIQNAGGIGNLATGDNHSGHMSATIGSPGQKKDPTKLSPTELQDILKEHNCLGETMKKFADNNVDGFLFSEKSTIDDLDIQDKFEKKRLLKIWEKLYS